MRLRHRFRATAAPRWPDAVSNFGSALLRYSRPRRQELMTSVSRRLLVETLEPRVLLSADLIPIQGNIAVPGQVDRYTLTLPIERQVLFDSETNNGSLNWSLTGPQGTVTSSVAFNSSDPVDNSNSLAPMDLVAGNYTLSVQGVRDAREPTSSDCSTSPTPPASSLARR
jgi:hypothetical protein